MEGTRIATVGIATFTVSLFAAIWILMCLVGRVTRQTWMYFIGGAMLTIVVIIFVASPRHSGSEDVAPTNPVYTNFYLNIGLVGAVVLAAAVSAIVCLAHTEALSMRRAKVIVERD